VIDDGVRRYGIGDTIHECESEFITDDVVFWWVISVE
jgi:hypothetical protein